MSIGGVRLTKYLLCFKDWMGDGFCDDEVNVPECNFDLGDCCNSGSSHEFCQNCVCFNGYEVSTIPATGILLYF